MEPQYVGIIVFLVVGALIGLGIYLVAHSQSRRESAYEYFDRAEAQARGAKFETLQRIAQVKADSAFGDSPPRPAKGDIIQGEWE